LKLVSDPAIADKISKMKERVRWREPVIQQRGIDQTRLVLEDGRADNPEFSFLALNRENPCALPTGERQDESRTRT
jgi:hypothetical protein